MANPLINRILEKIKNKRDYRDKHFGKKAYFRFYEIRNLFIQNDDGNTHKFLIASDGRNQIDRGRKTLENIEECIQYWYSYCAAIVPNSWGKIYEAYFNLNMHKQDVEIYDYGSGQGQATILLLDNFYTSQDKSLIKSINFIELSELALKISKNILKYWSPDILQEKIHLIKKDINMLDINDLKENENTYKIHLFSYILDMGVVDAKKLIEKILNIKGKHFIWAVSQNSNNDRMNKANINPKTNKLFFEEFYDELDLQISNSPNIEKKSQNYQIDLLNTKIINSSFQEKPILIFGRYIEVK